MIPSLPTRELTRDSSFSEDYKKELFYLWYSNGRPSSRKFHMNCPPDSDNKRPAEVTLRNWIQQWIPYADELDTQAKDTLDAEVVQAKVEMLKRHATVARTMQNKALDYLDKAADLNVNAAVRLLVEGVRIERESLGIPEALEKLSKASDEKLLAEIHALMNKGELSEIEDEI